jgi:hypothetical protein
MLSNDLADLCQVEVRTLVQSVKRNKDRFPADFMFQLNAKEYQKAIRACSVRSKMFIEVKSFDYLFRRAGETG